MKQVNNTSRFQQAIRRTLLDFSDQPLRKAALSFFNALGYPCDRTVMGLEETPSAQQFLAQFDTQSVLDQAKANVECWQSAQLLFQLTDEELSGRIALFKDDSFKPSLLCAYAVVAIDLAAGEYTRTEIAEMARQVHGVFRMPVMVLFRMGDRLSLAFIHQPWSTNAGKVMLIHGVDLTKPHNFHLGVLASLSLTELKKHHAIEGFNQFRAALEKVVSVDALSERFYREVSNWYFWALSEGQSASDLLCRLGDILFAWFSWNTGVLYRGFGNLPDHLLFGKAQKFNKEMVRGLVPILDDYMIACSENTSVEQEMAVGADALGMVFENLLALYKESSKAMTRRHSGRLHVPASLVDYMARESLKVYLQDEDAVKDRLEGLFSHDEPTHSFTEREVLDLVRAICACQVLDPACGAGAFLVGMLKQMMEVLGRLDPDNGYLKQYQMAEVKGIADAQKRKALLSSLEQVFSQEDSGYVRKLFLVENCLYGVDADPVARHLCKLHLLASLSVEKKPLDTVQVALYSTIESLEIDKKACIVIGRQPKSISTQDLIEKAQGVADGSGVFCLLAPRGLMVDVRNARFRANLMATRRIRQIVEFPEVLQGTCVCLFDSIVRQGNSFLLSCNNDVEALDSLQFERVIQKDLQDFRPGNSEFPLVEKGEFAIYHHVFKYSIALRSFMESAAIEGDRSAFVAAVLSSRLMAWISRKTGIKPSIADPKAQSLPFPKDVSQMALTTIAKLMDGLMACEGADQLPVKGFFLSVMNACVLELYFCEHMKERDLLFIDEMAKYLEAYDSEAGDAEQQAFLAQLYRTLNEPTSVIRNRLLRMRADSPWLLSVILRD